MKTCFMPVTGSIHFWKICPGMAVLKKVRTICQLQKYARRHLCSTSPDTPKVAIVGSGPGGFYTAHQVLKGHPTAHVDIYDKVPVPFGLVRFGVAPDHPEVKNCINQFTVTGDHPRCTFMGNVDVGRDITLKELRSFYTAVVLAYGSEDDRTLEIPGEDLHGVYSARAFVNWYNGLPEYRDLNPDLSQERAVVFGHGNVALDVARILLTPHEDLDKTDITSYAIDAIRASNIHHVSLVGRRGPLQVAFTIKELREMTKLQGTKPIIYKQDVEHLPDIMKGTEISRPRKRLSDLIIDEGLDRIKDEIRSSRKDALKTWELRFLRSPIEIIPDSSGTRVAAVKYAINRLQGEDILNQKAVATEETEMLECGMVLRSIGYKTLPLDEEIPFSHNTGTIPNIEGRVNGETGLFCSGWCKTGPVGVIQTTMLSSYETGKAVVTDLKSSKLSQDSKEGKQAVMSMLQQQGIRPVSFTEWKKIDKEEISRGQQKNKPREKIVDEEEMKNIAWS